MQFAMRSLLAAVLVFNAFAFEAQHLRDEEKPFQPEQDVEPAKVGDTENADKLVGQDGHGLPKQEESKDQGADHSKMVGRDGHGQLNPTKEESKDQGTDHSKGTTDSGEDVKTTTTTETPGTTDSGEDVKTTTTTETPAKPSQPEPSQPEQDVEPAKVGDTENADKQMVGQGGHGQLNPTKQEESADGEKHSTMVGQDGHGIMNPKMQEEQGADGEMHSTDSEQKPSVAPSAPVEDELFIGGAGDASPANDEGDQV